MIDGMVNWAMLANLHYLLTTTQVQKPQHAHLFNVLLGDFMSEFWAYRKAQPFGLSNATMKTASRKVKYCPSTRRVEQCRPLAVNMRLNQALYVLRES